MSFWEQMEERRRDCDVLAHPFYQRWASGELGSGDLAVYSSEYEHAVTAISTASRRAASLAGGPLDCHSVEEEEHVGLWRSFAKATGWDRCAWAYGEEPLPGTVECARVWAGDDDRGLAEHLAALYAIESAQPAISETKLSGLLDHYGFSAGAATEYFRLHAVVDHQHAKLMRSQLEGLLDRVDPQPLLAQAEAVHRSYWRLLDDVEALSTA
jgi:pyrroloquinoline quinone (PQQ) biosynthesis protein C